MEIMSTVEFRKAEKNTLRYRLKALELGTTRWLAHHALTLLRVSVGIVYLWFGALKLVPGMSPAEPLIAASYSFLPFPIHWFVAFVGIMEIVIGLGFISGRLQRIIIPLMLAHMGGAFSPIVLRPDLVWVQFPHVFTLEGQYIVKDIILVSAALVIAATIRGGGLTSEREVLALEDDIIEAKS